MNATTGLALRRLACFDFWHLAGASEGSWLHQYWARRWDLYLLTYSINLLGRSKGQKKGNGHLLGARGEYFLLVMYY